MKRFVEAELQTKLTGHRWEISGLEFSPNGLDLASCSWDKEVRIWDLSTLETRCLLKNQHAFPITSLAWRPGETSCTLATSSSDTTCCLWNTQKGEVLRVLEHDNWVLDCSFSPNGQHLATGCWDKTLRVWDVETATVLNSFSGHSSGIWSCEFSPVAAHVVCSGTEDGSIKVFDTRLSGNLVLSLVGGHEDSVKCCSWSADGQHLASGGEDMKIAVWDALTGSVLTRIRGHEDTVTNLKFYPIQGKLGVPFILSTGDKSCRFWYATRKDNKELLCLKQHDNGTEVQCLAVSKDGSLIATGGRDGKIALSSVKVHIAEAENMPPSQGHGAKLWKKCTRKVIERLSVSGSESCSSDTKSSDEDTYSDIRHENHSEGNEDAGVASVAGIVGAALHHQETDIEKPIDQERKPSFGTLMLKKTRTSLRHIDENDNLLQDDSPPERATDPQPTQHDTNGLHQEDSLVKSGVVIHHKGHHAGTAPQVPDYDQGLASGMQQPRSNSIVIHHKKSHPSSKDATTSRL